MTQPYRMVLLFCVHYLLSVLWFLDKHFVMFFAVAKELEVCCGGQEGFPCRC
jgi:hypothetical protein